MALNIIFQMDPPESFHFATDSTFLLALEGQRRGHQLSYYHPVNLTLTEKGLSALGHSVEFFDHPPFFSKGPEQIIDLHQADIIFIRQNPPFHMGYITATYMLDMLKQQPKPPLIVNDPASVRRFPEKIIPFYFSKWCPPTLITRNTFQIKDFWKKHGEIVLKPLYAYGGRDVLYIGPHERNIDALLGFYLKDPEPFIAQKYLPQITQGDKRILFIDGKVEGAFVRVPPSDSILSNLAAGGEANTTTLTLQEEELCHHIGPFLRENGLWFVGMDVIDGWITEINCTSPTGLGTLNRLENLHIEQKAWDNLERLYATAG